MLNLERKGLWAVAALGCLGLVAMYVGGTSHASDGAGEGESYTDIVVSLRTHGLDTHGYPVYSFIEWQNPDPQSASVLYPEQLDWSSPSRVADVLEQRVSTATIGISAQGFETHSRPHTMPSTLERGNRDRSVRPTGVMWSYIDRARLFITAPRSHDFWKAPIPVGMRLEGDLCTVLTKAADNVAGIALSCTGQIFHPSSHQPVRFRASLDSQTTLAAVVAEFLSRSRAQANIAYVANYIESAGSGQTLAISVKVAGVVVGEGEDSK